MARTVTERLAILEATFSELKVDVAEIKVDVKTLVATQNRQTGATKLASVIWAGLLSLGSLLSGFLMGRGHG